MRTTVDTDQNVDVHTCYKVRVNGWFLHAFDTDLEFETLKEAREARDRWITKQEPDPDDYIDIVRVITIEEGIEVRP